MLTRNTSALRDTHFWTPESRQFETAEALEKVYGVPKEIYWMGLNIYKGLSVKEQGRFERAVFDNLPNNVNLMPRYWAVVGSQIGVKTKHDLKECVRDAMNQERGATNSAAYAFESLRLFAWFSRRLARRQAAAFVQWITLS